MTGKQLVAQLWDTQGRSDIDVLMLLMFWLCRSGTIQLTYYSELKDVCSVHVCQVYCFKLYSYPVPCLKWGPVNLGKQSTQLLLMDTWGSVTIFFFCVGIGITLKRSATWKKIPNHVKFWVPQLIY